MPETLQTRTEHSRSLEDAERLRAIHTLKKMGLLIPVGEVESFHGRVRKTDETEPWGVDPTFANGGDDTGNSNYHLRPTLYSGEQEVAEKFAQERGHDTISAEYYDSLREKIRDYTPEQRDEWLNRINAQRKEQWDSYTDTVRAAFTEAGKSKAAPLTAGDLNDDKVIFQEVMRLSDGVSNEEKDQAFKAIAQNYRLSIHEITSNDTDAVVLNEGFQDTSLSSEDKQK